MKFQHGYLDHCVKVHLRNDALVRQSGRCAYCKDPLPARRATADHVVARRRGGVTEPGNIKACCQPCNALKGAMTEKRFMRQLRHPPAAASWPLLMAHMRWRIAKRLEKAERRILALVGHETGRQA